MLLIKRASLVQWLRLQAKNWETMSPALHIKSAMRCWVSLSLSVLGRWSWQTICRERNQAWFEGHPPNPTNYNFRDKEREEKVVHDKYLKAKTLYSNVATCKRQNSFCLKWNVILIYNQWRAVHWITLGVQPSGKYHYFKIIKCYYQVTLIYS